MKQKRKATSFQAWLITTVATINLIVHLFTDHSNLRVGILITFAVCETIFIFVAIGTWKKYFETLIDEKLNKANQRVDLTR